MSKPSKPINPSSLDDTQLKNLIQNYRNQGATDQPLFTEALAEEMRRHGKGLDFDKSFRVIREAARNGRFLSYKELADASGAEWLKVHYSVGNHLGQLVEYAHRKGWPLLSAIVVNKARLREGTMDDETLRGFINAARSIGYAVTDEKSFLKEQQLRVFEWGKAQDST
jgi:hypothetical protein